MKMKLLKVALILSVLLFGMQLPQVEAATYDGETTVNLNIRSLPSTKGTVITTLPRGTKVKYGTFSKSWHKVYWNNRTYYASAQYIRKRSTASSAMTKQSTLATGVTTVNLNIRVSAHRNATIVTTLKKGTEVSYAEYNSSWATVVLDGKTYYAAKAYITPKRTESTVEKQNGYANRELKLFSQRSQRSAVQKVLPRNTAVVSSIYNTSWSIVYIGSETYYAPTRGITEGTPKSEVIKQDGYANRDLKLFSERSQRSAVQKVLPRNTAVVSSIYNTSWSVVYIGSETYYAPTRGITEGTPKSEVIKQDGYANRDLKLFLERSQRSPVQKVLPMNTAIESSKFNTSWSVVYIGDQTYFTPTAWISSEKTPVEPPTSSQPEVVKVEGYANRTVNLFGKTHQRSPVLRVLSKYTKVTYSNYNSSWSKVYIGTDTYYTATSWLTEGAAPALSKGKVYTNTPGDVLNVRSSASLNSNVLGRLDHGTEVEHYGTVNGFYKFKFNGRDAYISADYVTTSKPSPSADTVIVLDAGHGGKDPGAVNGSLYEKTIAFDVTRRAEAYLRSKYNYEVRLTRSTDVYLTLNERVQAAKTLRGDLFVSIHVNAAGTSAAKGLETYYSSYSAHSARSRVLAANIQSNLSGKMSAMSNRGVKTANYYVIRYNTMPSALVELGFISSPTDLTYLQSAASRQRMAEGVAEGIAQYVRTYY